MGSLLSLKEICAPIYCMLSFDTHMTAVYLFAQEFRSRLFTIFFKGASLMNSRMANRVGGHSPNQSKWPLLLTLANYFSASFSGVEPPQNASASLRFQQKTT